MKHAVNLALLASLLTSCIFSVPTVPVGARGTDVRIRNDTAARITLIEVAQNSGSDLVSDLGVGEERVSLWQFSTGSKVTLRAINDTGQLIFCRRYTYDELRALQGRISIVEIREECR